mmetsp:Transcript_29116/g.44010  ORF Transcript_29116/g.44010 Transcript_29116/m.44010 type:complete len:200 (-) Transcript_29116:157-756(-)
MFHDGNTVSSLFPNSCGSILGGRDDPIGSCRKGNPTDGFFVTEARKQFSPFGGVVGTTTITTIFGWHLIYVQRSLVASHHKHLSHPVHGQCVAPFTDVDLSRGLARGQRITSYRLANRGQNKSILGREFLIDNQIYTDIVTGRNGNVFVFFQKGNDNSIVETGFGGTTSTTVGHNGFSVISRIGKPANSKDREGNGLNR